MDLLNDTHDRADGVGFVPLVQRRYDLTEGRIVIEGTIWRGLPRLRRGRRPRPYRKESVLRSLAENIAYARPDASVAAIEHTARLATTHDFIARLPCCYATWWVSAASSCPAANASIGPAPFRQGRRC